MIRMLYQVPAVPGHSGKAPPKEVRLQPRYEGKWRETGGSAGNEGPCVSIPRGVLRGCNRGQWGEASSDLRPSSLIWTYYVLDSWAYCYPLEPYPEGRTVAKQRGDRCLCPKTEVYHQHKSLSTGTAHSWLPKNQGDCCVWVHIQHMYAHTHPYTHACVYTHSISTYACARIYMHTHVCTHTSTCSQAHKKWIIP